MKGFNKYWGSSVENTLFDENENVGRGNRQKGFPRNTLLASFLDPRSKALRGFGVGDKMKIHNHVKLLMQKVQEQRCLDVHPLVMIPPQAEFWLSSLLFWFLS